MTPVWHSHSDYKALKKESYMEPYKEIHLVDFPKNTTIMLEHNFRKKFVRDFIDSSSSWRKAVEYLNGKSGRYNIKTKIGVGSLSHWFYGVEKTRGKTRRMPLWTIIEISKKTNVSLEDVENNLVEICTTGRGTPIKVKFPLYLTPELVSIAFHLFGDGHLAGKGQQSHYRQVNQDGLNNFKQKLLNCFGEFDVSIFEGSKVAIPRAISSFLDEYLNLGDCYWNKSQVNDKIKNMPQDFLLAGLNAFIIDEGHIGESIEIYSSNKNLLDDIVEIINKLGYISYGPKTKKERDGISYRAYISLKSAKQYYSDILKLEKKFPACGLAQKEKLLKQIVKRQTRSWKTRAKGKTKRLILRLLSKSDLNSQELQHQLNICGSTLREHLQKLENDCRVTKTRLPHTHCFLWSKVK